MYYVLINIPWLFTSTPTSTESIPSFPHLETFRLNADLGLTPYLIHTPSEKLAKQKTKIFPRRLHEPESRSDWTGPFNNYRHALQLAP
jgi:hypothetical protein